MMRSSFATRLRPSLAQPWLDAFAEFGVIPPGFKATTSSSSAGRSSANVTASSSDSSSPASRPSSNSASVCSGCRSVSAFVEPATHRRALVLGFRGSPEGAGASLVSRPDTHVREETELVDDAPPIADGRETESAACAFERASSSFPRPRDSTAIRATTPESHQ